MTHPRITHCLRAAVLAGGLTAAGLAHAQVELLANGDFSGGNSGFTSQYTNAANLVPEGTYAVTSNPNSVHGAFLAALGATSPAGSGGNVMVVNGATTAGEMVWGEQVALAAGVPHTFSGWITTVLRTDPAPGQLGVQLAQTPGTCGDAALVYDTIATLTSASTGPSWVQATATGVTRAAAGSYCLRLVNQQTAAGGNDFALDDLSFMAPAAVPTLGAGALAALGGLIALGWARQRRRAAGMLPKA